MSVLKKAKSRALPELPPPAEQHPEWVGHSAKIMRVCEGAESIRAEIRALEGTRLTVSARADEDAIAEVLGEALTPSVARREVDRIDGELLAARQRLPRGQHLPGRDVEDAVRRLEEVRRRVPPSAERHRLEARREVTNPP